MKLADVRDFRRWSGVGLLAVGHGFGDFNAGVLLAALGQRTGADLVTLYLLYNVLAFAGQPLAGVLCDRLGGMRWWFGLGGLLSAGSLLVAEGNPVMAVVCAGVASAFYHSAGGALAWELGGRRTLAAALFSAPGVVGLAVGLGVGSGLDYGQRLIGGGGLVVSLAMLAVVLRGAEQGEKSSDTVHRRGFGLMGSAVGWLIVIAIAARSFAWSAGQQAIFPVDYAVGLAVAAAIGKAMAGVLADRVGAGKIAVLALAVAAGFMVGGKADARWFFPAVVALQAATGPMMTLIFNEWPRYPALASGLAQGLAIALGAVPLFAMSSLGSAQLGLVAGALVTAAIITLWSTGAVKDWRKLGKDAESQQ